jgi:hypothetical protein
VFPSVPEIAEELTAILIALGRREEAGQYLDQAEAAAPPDDARILRARSNYHRGHPAKALEVARRLAEKHADDPLSIFEALRGLWQHDAREEARQVARAFLVSHPLPDTPFVSYVSGAARWILNDEPRAEFDRERSNETTPYRVSLLS